jgi:hypothetical protein
MLLGIRANLDPASVAGRYELHVGTAAGAGQAVSYMLACSPMASGELGEIKFSFAPV